MTAAVLGTNIGFFFLTLIPPLLWLVFYLQEDIHPEPKRLLMLAFIGGMLAAVPAIIAECGYIKLIGGNCMETLPFAENPFFLFIGIAFIEEYLKYFAVKFFIIGKPDFDEPVDAMIYMMTAALGFAAVENALFIVPLLHTNFLMGVQIELNRFLGANLLHALSSGIVGFFLARAYFSPHRPHFIALGIIIASFLHMSFDYLILITGSFSQFIYFLILLLSTMAVMVFIEFERLRFAKVEK